MNSASLPNECIHLDPIDAPELVIVIVSFNTRDLTLRCLETLFKETTDVCFEVVVWDNASSDGSSDAIAVQFPQVRLVKSETNLGFAEANNVAARLIEAEWLLLLNPDTEIQSNAVGHLLAFAKDHPRHGIYGGRTVFPDGSLNIASCWNRVTPWSLFCQATGLSTLFKGSSVFNTEAIGAWERDSVREVDIVVGCFLLIRLSLWRDLGGFDPAFWMYGEEADLCLRAREKGWRPVITPKATIMHLVGAASARHGAKIVLTARARATLIRRHWHAAWLPWGMAMMWLWAAGRTAAAGLLALKGQPEAQARFMTWREVWARRHEWLAGY